MFLANYAAQERNRIDCIVLFCGLCFNDILRIFEGCFKVVPRLSEGCPKNVFLGCLKGVNPITHGGVIRPPSNFVAFGHPLRSGSQKPMKFRTFV